MDCLYCAHCTSKYDISDHLPKILPCLGLKCLKCLKKDINLNIKDEYYIHCTTCSSTHLVSSVIDLPTSDIIVHLLNVKNEVQQENKQEINEENLDLDDEYESKPIKGQQLSDFSEKFKEKNRIEYFEIHKHYDQIIGDIDIRAESLIEFIHKSREDIQKKVKDFRDESLKNFVEQTPQSTVKEEDISIKETKEMKAIKEKLSRLDDDLVKSPEDLKLILKESNKFQQYLYQLKKNLWYFTENSMKLENSLLGHTLNGKFDRNFLKIRNLTSLLSNSNSLNKICLASDFSQSVLRQEVLTLNRVVKIYFSTYRTLHFEAFDLHGNLSKSLNAFEGLSSFPISAGFGQYFVVCFTSQNTEGNHNIRLYDINLNIVKSITKFTSIESVFMNESYIILFYAHKTNECCQVYDCKLNELFSFGQQTNKENPFFMEKSILNWQEEKKMSFKLNPKIFGINEKYIYLCNFNKMSIMSRQTGKIVRSLNLIGNRPYFLLDLQSNVIQVNTLGKKIALYNSDIELLIESIYEDHLDTISITKENKLVFVDVEKKSIIYI